MQMIAVRGVIVGRESDREQFARAAPHLAQERRALGIAIPVFLHRDPRRILQAEARYVDCLGGCVLAPAFAAVADDVAAAIAPEMLDRADALAEMPERR